LKDGLQKLSEEMSAEFEESIEAKPDSLSDLDFVIHWPKRARQMSLMYIPKTNSVRWEMPGKYGIVPIPESPEELAKDLMQKLRKG
jgi:hypothetical protein